MLSKIKESLDDIQQQISQLSDVENSLLLVKFFYHLKDLLDYRSTSNLIITETTYHNGNIAQFFVASYRDEDGRQTDNLYQTLQLSNGDLRTPEYIEEYAKIVKIIRSEKVKLPQITKNLTVEDFLSHFDKKHIVNYLDCTLANEVSDSKGRNKPKLKV